jgi:hypothetical protein
LEEEDREYREGIERLYHLLKREGMLSMTNPPPPSKPFDCVLCKNHIEGQFGNRPYPLSETGKCCDNCNSDVIRARFSMLGEEIKEK